MLLPGPGYWDPNYRLVWLIHLSELEGSTMPPRLQAQICQLKVLIQLMLRTLDIVVLCPQILTSCCTTQNSPSLFRQPNVQWFKRGRSAGVRDREQNHMKVHVPPSFSSRSPHSPGNSSFSNDMPWGNLRSVLRIVIESIFK
ncbi:hypothetical protein J1N35_009524 [Gossypium stocksii]|uniref:Uncharacterized protein n=1 Tax=Gossypium stocksii TaxID=47602 RepID=A0A9D3VY78_9ROSI|nr:hypothetical protein J1N35_009524 [Gossypium stocksii]